MEMTNADFQHLRSDIKEIKHLLEQQNSRVRKNEVNIAANETWQRALEQRLNTAFEKIETLSDRNHNELIRHSEKEGKRLQRIEDTLKELKSYQDKNNSMLTYIRKNGVLLLMWLSLVVYEVFNKLTF